MLRRVTLLLLLSIAACATPYDQCVSRATKDLRVVNALIEETRANIERGYALEEFVGETLRLTICTGKDGVRYSCWEPETTRRVRPKAIDLNAERAKLASLIEKKADLETEARAAIRSCEGLEGAPSA